MGGGAMRGGGGWVRVGGCGGVCVFVQVCGCGCVGEWMCVCVCVNEQEGARVGMVESKSGRNEDGNTERGK